MEGGFFEAVEAISPWWWVAFALALGVIEMATMSFFLLWPALAALVMAGVVAFAPGLSGELRITIFALLALGLTFGGRSLMRRFGAGDGTQINRRSSQLVGRRAKVLKYEAGEGTVEVDGTRWTAHWEEASDNPNPERVTITAADGMTLSVRTEEA